jgi:hypothetical protein
MGVSLRFRVDINCVKNSVRVNGREEDVTGTGFLKVESTT